MAGSVKGAGRLLGFLLAGWIFSWLSLGLWQGAPLVLLRPGCPDFLRIPYLAMLYLTLVASTAYCWRRWGPSWVSWGGAGDFVAGYGLGTGFLLVQRGILWAGRSWNPPTPFPWGLLGLALVTSPLLAWAEEWVFRGYLYGVLREERGRWTAAIGVNAFFASVHLFRPGSAGFKVALGLGLFLVGLILTLALERRGRLLLPIGLHSAWIVAIVVDPPVDTVPGLWSGLHGESVAGVLSWLLLLVLGWALSRRG
ncbi:unnamed protein product [Phaeothamnion confervicola]